MDTWKILYFSPCYTSPFEMLRKGALNQQIKINFCPRESPQRYLSRNDLLKWAKKQNLSFFLDLVFGIFFVPFLFSVKKRMACRASTPVCFTRSFEQIGHKLFSVFRGCIPHDRADQFEDVTNLIKSLLQICISLYQLIVLLP